MTDTPAVVAPGAQSSEYFLTKVMVALGAITTVAGAVLGALPATVGGPYLPIAMVVVGLATAFFKARGYSAGRIELKVASAGVVLAQNSPQMVELAKQVLAAVNAIQAAAPLLAAGKVAGNDPTPGSGVS